VAEQKSADHNGRRLRFVQRAVGVSSNSANTGSSFRGKAGPSNRPLTALDRRLRAARAIGEEEGPSDLSRETSRRMKAGPWIRRAARHCSYPPPMQSRRLLSRRSGRPPRRRAAMRETGESQARGIGARHLQCRQRGTRRRGRRRLVAFDRGGVDEDAHAPHRWAQSALAGSPPPVFLVPSSRLEVAWVDGDCRRFCDSSVSDQLDGRPGVLKGGRATRRAQLLCFGRNVRWGSASARQRRLPLARNESGADR
jgi:hypothetical protein